MQESKGGVSAGKSSASEALGAVPVLLLSDRLTEQQTANVAWASFAALRNSNATALVGGMEMGEGMTGVADYCSRNAAALTTDGDFSWSVAVQEAH